MNRARFQRMKRSAFFINIGRGMTTRLDDLVAALRAGEIAGAGLDVFEQEPLPADHPLWTMPGVLITPHTAGHGPYLDERRFDVLRDNAGASSPATRCATSSTSRAGFESPPCRAIERPSRRRYAPPQDEDKSMMALRKDLILRSPRSGRLEGRGLLIQRPRR